MNLLTLHMYQFLDIFFFIFHTALVLFNTFGWLIKRLRPWNLITLLLTAGSWFILGIWYGWGYCPCTDWHWSVRSELGYEDHTNSYVNLLLRKLMGIHLSDETANTLTAVVFITSLVISLFLNIKSRLRQRKA